MPETLSYLGDSVYIRDEGHSIYVFLNNGDNPHNHICMEPEVLKALKDFVDRAWGERSPFK